MNNADPTKRSRMGGVPKPARVRYSYDAQAIEDAVLALSPLSAELDSNGNRTLAAKLAGLLYDLLATTDRDDQRRAGVALRAMADDVHAGR